jgi:hypothetical protein
VVSFCSSPYYQNAERVCPVQQFNNQYRLGAVFTLKSGRVMVQSTVVLAA